MVLSMRWLYWLVCRMDVSCNVLSHWPRSMMRCCARLWTSWHLKKTCTIVIQPNAPWYKEEITTQKRKRWRLKHKWRSTGLEIDKVNYLEQCNVVKWNHAHPLNKKSSLSILSVVTCWWWARGCLSIFKRAIKMFLFSKYI